MLTAERLKELLSYDPETGDFTWRKNGKWAGCRRHDGYVIIGVDTKLYLRHRLAWLYVTGEWPSRDLDHANCVKGDDRWLNLRVATKSENLGNVKKPSTNKSGRKGVHWHPQSKQWRVQISNRPKKHIGMFPTVEEAAAAYAAAAAQRYGVFARLD